MSEVSQMWTRPTFEILPSAISSPALACGATASDLLDGPMTENAGLDHVPVNHSAQPASRSDLTTNGIFGQLGIDLFGNVVPPESSGSKSPHPSGEYLSKTRICRKCKVEKSYSEFYVNSKGNRPHLCKDCVKERERTYKQSKPELIAERYSKWRQEKRGFALVNVARNRAKSKGVPFDLDPEDIQARIDRGSCEITGIPFDLTKPRSWNAPSLDRINPSEGYIRTNTRVILYSLNVMANVWGINKVVEVGNSILAQRTKRSDGLTESLKKHLEERLEGAGSTFFSLTWKKRVTPAGRLYWERAASARRTSDSACTSVRSPDARSGRGGLPSDPNDPIRRMERGNSLPLESEVLLATVPTPMAGSPATETYNAAGNNDYSRKIVELASVPTPMEYDAAGGGSITAATRKSEGMKRPSGASYGSQLRHEVMLCNVASPSARDYKDSPGMSETGVDPDGSIRSRLDQLPRQAQLADSGLTATGGTPATKSIGQLNPDYSRWLMGLPIEFSSCADMAMQSWRKSRKSSSKP